MLENTYTINPTLNKNKIFLLQKSEVEKRLDPYYYVPTLVELGKKVLAKHPKKLRDYVVSLSSGATPKRVEEEKYYSDIENGIPFLRVQNVTEWGLDLSDVKYINKETHDGLLKRSQVFENDLLVTITGRIASAAVAPKGFEGNINQHSVVIKTESKEVSEILAAYLNCSVGQKLAFRNTTGGTRPALDYPALLSITILADKRVLEITKRVAEQKKQNEAQTEKLLASIDDYLLKELGINLPTPPENILKNRMFTTTIREISGERFDPFYYKKIYTKTIAAIQKGKFRTDIIKHLIIDLKNGVEIRNYVDEGIRYLRVTDLTKNGLNNSSKRFVAGQEIPERIKLNKNCILISRSGSLGLVNIVEDEIMDSILSSHIFKVELNTSQVDTIYLEGYLRSHLGQSQIFRTNNGGVIPEINQDALKSIRIVLPSLTKQKEIAEHITDIRKQAQQLKDKTKEALEKAGKEIESILIS